MLRYALLLLLSCCAISGQAQQLKPADFNQYTTANGLSDNGVNGIAEDARGYLWLSTRWGLNRFDGNRFIPYYSNNDSNSLPSNEMWGISWLDKNRFAIYGTAVHIVNTATAQQQNLYIPYHEKKYQFKFNMTMKVLGDEEGNMYVLSRSGFYHFDKTKQLVSRFDYYKEKDVPLYHFVFGAEMLELDKNKLLIISVNGLYVYDKQKKKLDKMPAGAFPLLDEFISYPGTTFYFFQVRPGEFFVFKVNENTVIYVDLNRQKKTTSLLPIHAATEIAWRSKLLSVNDSCFYITGHLSGIYSFCLDRQTGTVRFDPAKQLETFSCNTITKGRDGRLLVGTNKGLLRQKLRQTPVETAMLPAGLWEQFPNARFDDVYISGDNKVYAATREAGLAVFDKTSFSFERNLLFRHIGEGAGFIRAITAVNKNTLLLGVQNSPLLFNTVTGSAKPLTPAGWDVPYDWVSDLLRDNSGNIWINSKNIYRYNTVTGAITKLPQFPQLLDGPVNAASDYKGNIWFASHGIARYNVAAGKFDLYLDSFPFIKIPDKQVGALSIDRQDRVWFGSNNNGLIMYDTKTKTYRQFSKKDGLPDDVIYATILVNDVLWLACHSGIACIDTRTFHISSFGKADGFPDGTIGEGSRFFYDTAGRQLYIGFTNAIARFDPQQLLSFNTQPKTFIESVLLNGSGLIYLPGQTISTSWKNKGVTVTIGSINFFDGPTERYAYRIMDKEAMPWTAIGSQSSFSISKLAPGDHTLQVKIYSANNRWPEQVQELQLLVSYPFWQRTWFIVAAILLLLFLIYCYVKWRSSVVRRKEMQNTQIEKLRAEDYKAQFELEQISNYFSSSLADKKTEEAVLWDVAANLIGRLNYEDCIIYLWNSNKTKLVQKAAYGPKASPGRLSTDAFEVEPGVGIVGHVLQTKKPLLVNDTRKDPRYRIDDEFRLSELAVPVIHNDELLGVIDSEHSQANYFSERDIKILTTIATLIGNKLKQLESERSLEAKKQELAGINEQLAEARLSALQTQMNPHFVFNALNSIKRMILDADNEKASRYLSKFALMIRMTLEHSKVTFVTLQDNIQYLKAYLEMEKLRFDSSFSYQVNTDDKVDITETLMPSMMIQPLVENAIWHGLMYAEGSKQLTISFAQQENRITCVIEDNGIGIQQSEKLKKEHRPMHRSMGLENLRNRIRIMNEKYKTDCTMEITDLAQSGSGKSGTRVILELNIINL